MYRFIMFVLLSFSFSFGETLEQVISTALKESPFLKVYQFKIKAIDGKIKKAKSFKNPELEAKFGRLYSQSGDSGVALTSFSIRQPLRLWGERKYAILAAQFEKDALRYLYEAEKNSLLSQVYNQFFYTLALKEKIKVKEREVENLKSVLGFLEKSYKLGEALPVDILRAKKELMMAQINLNDFKAKEKASLLTLSALVGKQIKDVEGNLYKIKGIKPVNLDNLPYMKYISKLITSIDQQIKRQKALAKPKVSVGLSVEEDPVDLGKYEAGLSFSSTLPVFYKNEGEIIQLLNKKRMLYAKKRQKKLEYTSKLKALQQQLDVYKAQIKKLDLEVIPASEKALNLSEKSFKMGVMSFFELSNVRKQYFETLLYKIDLLQEVHSLHSQYIKIGGLR